jgi:hypothetical protein
MNFTSTNSQSPRHTITTIQSNIKVKDVTWNLWRTRNNVIYMFCSPITSFSVVLELWITLYMDTTSDARAGIRNLSVFWTNARQTGWRGARWVQLHRRIRGVPLRIPNETPNILTENFDGIPQHIHENYTTTRVPPNSSELTFLSHVNIIHFIVYWTYKASLNNNKRKCHCLRAPVWL